MRYANRTWKEERDGIYLRVKRAIEAELLLCQEEHGIKLAVLNIDSLLIGYSKLNKPTILSKGLRTDSK